MLQGLVDADPLGWVEHQDLIHQVSELNHLLPLVLWKSLTTNHVIQKILSGVDAAHHCHFFLKSREDRS